MSAEDTFHIRQIGDRSDDLHFGVHSSSIEADKIAQKRDVRAIIDLMINVVDTLHQSAKLDVQRAKERESYRASLIS